MPAALFLIIAAILFRVLPPALGVHHDWMANFSPLASLVICGAVYLPKRFAIWAPLIILLISDWVLNVLVYHYPLFSWDILPRYVVFAVIGAAAYAQRRLLSDERFALLGTTVAASLLYYLATNSASWLGDAGYTKNAAGWWQAITVGLPGYAPTFVFLRNSVISDLLFTGLFLGCMSLTSKKEIILKTKTVAAH